MAKIIGVEVSKARRDLCRLADRRRSAVGDDPDGIARPADKAVYPAVR